MEFRNLLCKLPRVTAPRYYSTTYANVSDTCVKATESSRLLKKEVTPKVYFLSLHIASKHSAFLAEISASEVHAILKKLDSKEVTSARPPF